MHLRVSDVEHFIIEGAIIYSIPVTIVNTLKQNQAIENSIAWPVISLLPGHVICHMTAM